MKFLFHIFSLFGLFQSKANIREIRFMDGSGDTPIRWDIEDPAAVERARQEWDRICNRMGRTMFEDQSFSEGGGKEEKFNPKKNYIAVKPVYGG